MKIASGVGWAKKKYSRIHVSASQDRSVGGKNACQRNFIHQNNNLYAQIQNCIIQISSSKIMHAEIVGIS
jgi:hypothetical protein